MRKCNETDISEIKAKIEHSETCIGGLKIQTHLTMS